MNFTPEQLKAIKEKGKNILVSAGAGSGKTRVLTERVYEHIINGIDIDRLLVLTFTNAAASEMKGRIRKRINENEGNKLSKDKINLQLNKLDSSYISTFDAFALALVKKYHYVLDLDNNISIIDKNIINIKTNEFVNELLLNEYERKDSNFIKLINEFCVKSDDNIVNSIIEINNKLNNIYLRDDYINNYEDTIFNKDKIETEFINYEKLLINKIKLIDTKLDEFSSLVDDYHSVFVGIDDLLQAKDYESIKAASEKIEVKRLSGMNEDGASKKRSDIKKLVDEIKALTSFSKDEHKKHILDTKDNALVLISLAEKLNNKLMEYKKSINQYEFSDIFRYAIELVDKHDDIKEELKEYFYEILIDEYQDTNDLQDEFISRVSNNNVYMVGDVKQSIYEFRNANPKLFLKKYYEYSNSDTGLNINLLENFRSRSEVLEGINIIFDKLMDNNIGGANYEKSHHLKVGQNKYEKTKQDNNLEILSYPQDYIINGFETFKDFDKNEVEAFVVANDIKNKVNNKYQISDENFKLRNASWSDFCILVDRSTEFDLYKQILTYLEIPSVIISDEKMDESDLITALRSIFKLIVCVVNNEFEYDFKYSYVSVCRSFLMEAKDSEIYETVKKENYVNSVLYKKIERIIDKIDLKTISEILDNIIDEFDIYIKLNLIGDVHENMIKIDYLYQLAHKLNEIGYSYKDFNDYLINVFDNNEDNITFNIDKSDIDAVKIMTIHKSKGLEFNVCYYPTLYKKFNTSDLKDRITFSKDLGIVMPVYINNKGLKDTIIKELFKNNYRLNNISEKIRLLYVALTRAKEKIILVGPITKDTGSTKLVDDEERLSVNSFADMLNLISTNLDNYKKEIRIDKLGLTKDYKLNRKDIFKKISKGNNIEIIKQKEVKPVEIIKETYSKKVELLSSKTKEAISLGTKLHYYLEVIDFNNPKLELVEKDYQKYIMDFLSSDIMKNVCDAKVYKEFEFVDNNNKENKHGVIDLLLEYKDHFVIIDYKTKNIDDEKYVEQLNGYRKYIQSITNKKVYCYLYSLIDSNYKEI